MLRLTILFCLYFATLGAHSAEQPNILLIYVDDLGYGDTGRYGHPVIRTPNLDSLADDGLVLAQYYAPSAVCSPSRAGLLTGRMPYRTGIKDWIPHGSDIFLRAAEITLAEVLKDAGYSTALIGKWHLNSDLASDLEPQPTNQGFDYFYGHNAFQKPHNHNPVNIFRNKRALPMQEGYTADLYADEAIKWLKERDERRPFFMYLSMAEPHTTIANPPEYNQMYSQFIRGEIEPVINGLDNPPLDALVPRGPGEYYANITYMDAQIGRVIAWLKENDLYGDTVIVFASDNGPVKPDWLHWWEINAHGSTGGLRGRKHYLYEGGIRVPAIVSYPGRVRPGSVSDTPVIGMDWFVTLAKLGGGVIPKDRNIDGVDIIPLLDGTDVPDRSLFWAMPAVDEGVDEVEYAIRHKSWKLMLNAELVPQELYNLDNDPLEFINLVESRGEIVQELVIESREILQSIANDRLRPASDET